MIREWVEAEKLIKSPFAAVAFLRCFLQLKFSVFVFFFYYIFFFNTVVRNSGLVLRANSQTI